MRWLPLSMSSIFHVFHFPLIFIFRLLQKYALSSCLIDTDFFYSKNKINSSIEKESIEQRAIYQGQQRFSE
jgi:hypothetical protein